MVEWLKNKKGGLSLRYFLAIDIGASSGRHIVGWQENGEIKTNEVYRFPNGVQEANGHLTWDVCKLFANVVDGILEAFKQHSQLESLSIDAWGVDYVPPRLGRAQRHNISYLLNTEEVGEYLDLNHVILIIPLGFDATSIIGKIFIVTGPGKYFKNVDGDPQTNLSIVRIAEDGQTAKLLWGYKDGGKFTSDDGPVKA